METNTAIDKQFFKRPRRAVHSIMNKNCHAMCFDEKFTTISRGRDVISKQTKSQNILQPDSDAPIRVRYPRKFPLV